MTAQLTESERKVVEVYANMMNIGFTAHERFGVSLPDYNSLIEVISKYTKIPKEETRGLLVSAIEKDPLESIRLISKRFS